MDRPDDPLPPYAFVPGGPFPHPISDPKGHSFGRKEGRPDPIDDERWCESSAYLRGFALFDEGYYWEAHEVWEGLWHAHGRTGVTANLLKALIKLAAAGVKVRQAQRHGVVTHAARAAAILAEVRGKTGPTFLGLDLDRLIRFAEQLASEPEDRKGSLSDPVACVFGSSLGPIMDR